MTRLTFTDSLVAEAKAPASTRVELWDSELPGFGLRVSGTGRKTWQLMYRLGGRKRRLTLGGYPALPLEVARDAALTALDAVARGRDPAAERTALTGGPLTFERLARAYLDRHAKPRKESWRSDQRMIEQDLLPAWGRRAAETVTRRDVIELLEGVVRRGHPVAANRRLALIRGIYAWGLEVDMVPATPVVGVRTPARERPRERVLAEPELAALWRACDEMGWPFGPLFQLALLTAQRRGAVAGLRLADIALASQVWTLPAASAGRDRGQVRQVPLAAFAVEILASQPRLDSAYVFPARGRPERPVSGFSAAARRAAKLAGVADFQPGDLRRSAAAGMVRLGVPLHVVKDLLGHRGGPGAAPSWMTGGGGLLDEKRRALEAWAGQVQEIVGATEARLLPLR